jgi:hypothetical protein
VNGERRNLEVLLQVRFRRGLAMDLGVVINEPQAFQIVVRRAEWQRLGDMFDLHVTPFLPEVFGDETAMAVMRLFLAAKQAAVVCERFPSPYARGGRKLAKSLRSSLSTRFPRAQTRPPASRELTGRPKMQNGDFQPFGAEFSLSGAMRWMQSPAAETGQSLAKRPNRAPGCR